MTTSARPKKALASGLAIHWADEPMAEMRDLIAAGEDCRYDNLWFTNDKFFHDMFVTMTWAAGLTSTATLGTFVADPYSVHPALTTMAAATLDKISGGRAVICLGAGGTGFREMKIKRARVATAIREAAVLMRRLLRNEPVDFPGEVISFAEGRLGMEARADIPIIIATRGELVLQVAGEVADGVVIATYAEAEGIRHALAQIERGVAKAGRTIGELDLISRVDTCIHEDEAAAMDAVRMNVAVALWSSYPDRQFVTLSGLTVPDDLEEIIAKRDYELLKRNMHLVPDSFVRKFAWAGSVETVARQIADIARLGVNSFTIMPIAAPGDTRVDVARRFALEVMPRARELAGK